MSCNGFRSYYGPCGAYDCSNCYPGGDPTYCDDEEGLEKFLDELLPVPTKFTTDSEDLLIQEAMDGWPITTQLTDIISWAETAFETDLAWVFACKARETLEHQDNQTCDQHLSKGITNMKDRTENIRRKMVAEINADPGSREALEAAHGQVWDTAEMQEDFEVVGFMTPFVGVTRKADNVTGTLKFQHSPRFYFGFMAG